RPSIEFALLHIEVYLRWRIVHHVARVLVGDACIGLVRRSTATQVELPTELERMRAAEQANLFLDVVARRNAPLLPFALRDRGHPCIHYCRYAATDSSFNLRLCGVALVKKLFNSFSGTRVNAKVCRGCPPAAADHIGSIPAEHLAPECPRIQRLLRGLILRR